MNGKLEVMTRGDFIKEIGRKASAFMKKLAGIVEEIKRPKRNL
jgi:hypothetical protein